MSKLFRKIKNLFKAESVTAEQKVQADFEIPSYELKRAIIDSYKQKYNLDYFIETGTFLGDTMEYFKSKFDKLYSIELSEELAQRAQKRFANNSHITIIQGNSGEIFETFISQLDKPALFWLDGHYSSEFFHNGEFIKTAKADKNTPIEKELDMLLQSPFKNIILIDDARLFVGQLDYPTIETLQKKLQGTNYQLSVHTDIIHIVPVS